MHAIAHKMLSYGFKCLFLNYKWTFLGRLSLQALLIHFSQCVQKPTGVLLEATLEAERPSAFKPVDSTPPHRTTWCVDHSECS